MTTDETLFEVPASAPPPSAVEAAAGTASEWADEVQHERITWVDIAPTGVERPRTGYVWADARAVPGRGSAVWALADPDADGHVPEPGAVLVITAGRRHRVGRVVSAGHVGRTPRWLVNGGRYVDKGERYRETDSRSPGGQRERVGRTGNPPRSISGRPTTVTAQTDYENWLRIAAALSKED